MLRAGGRAAFVLPGAGGGGQRLAAAAGPIRSHPIGAGRVPRGRAGRWDPDSGWALPPASGSRGGFEVGFRGAKRHSADARCPQLAP